MTAEEQLALWAAAPNDELFVSASMSSDDRIFATDDRIFATGSLGSADKPYIVARMSAGDALARLQGKGAANGVARDVLARFGQRVDPANSMRVREIQGVTCVIVEGRSPGLSHAPFRLLLSPVEAFS